MSEAKPWTTRPWHTHRLLDLGPEKTAIKMNDLEEQLLRSRLAFAKLCRSLETLSELPHIKEAVDQLEAELKEGGKTPNGSLF